MPEGPELMYMAEFINEHDRKVGPFVDVSMSTLATHPRKHPQFQVPHKRFRLSASSRGKELIITFMDIATSKRSKRNKRSKQTEASPKSLLVRAGMTGNFHVLQPGEEMPKHAHLRFHGASGHVLYFHDPRRFGSWHVDGVWGQGDGKRGPCIIQEPKDVRQKIRASLASRVFSRPICEVMLNQAFFNGMGNYLRAEILHRAKIHPFSQARAVLADALLQHEEPSPKQELLKDEEERGNDEDQEEERQDSEEQREGFFFHCQQVLRESVTILRKHGFGGDAGRARVFEAWLQCYTKLNKKLDGHGRTMWFGSGLRKMRALPATSRKVQLLVNKAPNGGTESREAEASEEEAAAVKEEAEEDDGEPSRKRAKQSANPKSGTKASKGRTSKKTKAATKASVDNNNNNNSSSSSRRRVRVEMKDSRAVTTPLRRSPRVSSRQRRTR